MATVTIKEETLRDLSRFADPEITFVGGRVRVVLYQELFDLEGASLGTASVSFEGKRNFGRTVTFASPVKAMVEGAPADEVESLQKVAQFALEAISTLSEGK